MQEFIFGHQGVRLHGYESGSGRPVVLLHGGMADHRAALPYAMPLAERFRVILPDQRGSGRSWFGGEIDYGMLARDVDALLDHLGLVEAVIIGISGGTAVAAAFALTEPSRVRGFGAVMPCFAGSEAGFTPEQRAIFADMDAIASRAPIEGIEVVRPLYEQVAEPYRKAAIAMALEFDPASLAASSRLLASGAQPFANVRELRLLRMPALIAHGGDAVHPRAISEAWAAALPDCRTVEPGDPQLVPALLAFCERAWGEAGAPAAA